MSSDGWEDDDDDDDMADMFSFGNDQPTPPPEVDAPSIIEGNADSIQSNTKKEEDLRDRANTDDSFLDLLEEADSGIDLEKSSAVGATALMDEQETQDILNWLDEEEATSEGMFDLDGDKAESLTNATGDVSRAANAAIQEAKPETDDTKDITTDGSEEASSSQASSETAPTIVALPPAPAPAPVQVPKPIVFESLEDALHHRKSTVADIRSLFVQGGMKVDAEHRPQLWCRSVCSGKTLDQVSDGSVADSFLKWREHCQEESAQSSTTEHTVWIREESALLAERIVTCDSNRSIEEARRDLADILLFHYQSSSKQSDEDEPNNGNDPLLPPVACALLSAGVPTVAASVMLSSIMPTFMPLLALTQDERMEAAKSLHSQFYLLACYHLPLLVFHLDRYAPGWHWPKNLKGGDNGHDASNVTQKSRNLEQHGVVPQSWLISHLAGECGGTLMNPMWLLSLWDLILTSSNNSLRFFLSLAVLEKYSDHLLMMTGSQLVDELNRILEFKEGTTIEGFAIEGEEETSEKEAIDWVQDWCNRAQTLWEATPRTVVSRLRSAEDEAVRNALLQRQKMAEEKLNARLEAEAKAHREAVEAERERKAEEARQRVTRARLVAYYRKHNPEKEGNIDKILKTYEGRLDVLDRKLKAKYGTGFNPALKPKPLPPATSKLFPSMNQSFAVRRTRNDQAELEKKESSAPHRVAVAVSAREVLPVVCWSKTATAQQITEGSARGRYSEERHRPLKFYLVDSRPEVTVAEQGRFPTAVSMSPESLLDPDRMRQHEEMFESLRGAVHICVMGEGYSSVPALYGQRETDSLRQLMAEDESRTSLCALFFVKKGFPFVSVLEGGFVQAHSWLCREGSNRHLNASSVLVDYDSERSLFAQMEKAYRQREEFDNLPSGEKATRVMQNLFDSSMTSLTRNKYRIDSLASRMETTEGRSKVRDSVTDSVSKLFTKKEDESVNRIEVPTVDPAPSAPTKSSTPDGEEGMVDVEIEPDASNEDSKKGSLFRNPFVNRRSIVPDTAQVDATAVDFAPVEESLVEPPIPPTTSPFASHSKTADKGDDSSTKFAKTLSSKSSENGTPANRFVGLGSALGKSMKSESNGDPKTGKALKRNPFARFSTKGDTSQNLGSDVSKPNRFGGINQLRLSTLSNLRSRAAQEEVRAASQAAEVEESISFFENNSPVAARDMRDSVPESAFLSAVSAPDGTSRLSSEPAKDTDK